jgi:conjugal transfer pilus assembly protein TraF
MSVRWLILCFSACLISPSAAHGTGLQANGVGVSYYHESKHGWWWYEKEPEKQKEKKDEPAAEAKPKKLPSLRDYTMEDIWNMHPDEFEPLLREFLKKAVQSPTEENVRKYYVLTDVARRKSLAFTNVAAFVWQKYPELSTAKDYPVAAPGRNAFARQALWEVENTIQSARSDFALLYFHSPT